MMRQFGFRASCCNWSVASTQLSSRVAAPAAAAALPDCGSSPPWLRAASSTLFSKPTQRTFAKKAASKAKTQTAKKNKSAAQPEDMSNLNDMGVLFDIVNSPRRKRPKLSEEEAARNFEIGRLYNVETTRQHNRENWKLQLQIDLKRAAMDALPPEQREHVSATQGSASKMVAMRHDDDPPPPHLLPLPSP